MGRMVVTIDSPRSLVSFARMPSARLAQNVQWLGHAGFLIRVAGKAVYIDPYRSSGGPSADVILITHDHFDHFSPDDVKRLSRKGTRVVAPASVTEQIRGPALSIAAGEVVELDALEVTAVPAYNTNKLNSEGQPFHPREAGGVGYLIRVGGERLYHSGDTDVIPEMDQAAGVDIALLPVSGIYVMTAAEAAEAARRIEPSLAIPMHWGTVIGSRADAEEFQDRASIRVQIPERATEDGEKIG
jgi:L-ascorbate metabolism protein UlaG (beta-lactamase superfamily)